MELNKTIKIQLYVSDVERAILLNSMTSYKNACNYISQYIFETKNLNQNSIQRNVYNYCRTQFKLPAQMTCSTIRTVISSYRSIIGNNHLWEKCVYKKPQVMLMWNRDYSINKEKFSIGTIHGRIKLNYAKTYMEQYFDKNKYQFGAARLIYRHNKFYLHISITYNVDELGNNEVSNVVGIDRGIRFIATTYDSRGKTNFYSGNIIKQKRSHYKALRKELQQVGTSSSRKRLKAIGHRENRWMQDINHCVSKALVENNPDGTLFVLEDLTGIRSATEKVKLKDRYILVSWSYYDLEQKLIYKSLNHKQKVIKVNPRYTSQTCPKCGHIDKSNRNKKLHKFCCKNCGYSSNDDRIGAMNLYRMGIEYLIESQISTSNL